MRGTSVGDERARRRVFEAFMADLNQPSSPARLPRPQRVEDWLAGSPLAAVAVDFTDDDTGTRTSGRAIDVDATGRDATRGHLPVVDAVR